jgi:hypothetical protein
MLVCAGRWKASTLAFLLLPLLSCRTAHPRAAFRVLPARPNYLLRAPDSHVTPFPEVLSQYSEAGEGLGWLLHPNTELHIENAYYREGAPKRGVANFLGTEKAVYQVRSGGLRLESVRSGLERLPPDQLPVQRLVGTLRMRYRYYRYFFQIVFRQRADTRGAVLLGAATMPEVDLLAGRLMIDPDAVCTGTSPHCAVFPEACTVALEMTVTVNGSPRSTRWGSLLDSIVKHPMRLHVSRLHEGKPTAVEIDASDPNALQLPLLPGDRIEWE